MALLVSITVTLYLIASWRLVRDAMSAERGHRGRAHASALAVGSIAALAHLTMHVSVWQRIDGVELRFFSALSLVALGMAVFSTGVAWTRRFDALGGVVYPLAALFAGIYALQGNAQVEALSWRLKLHALLALLAFATLAVAAILALMLWFQEAALRRRELDAPLLRWLPPLTELETLLFRSIAVGFGLLTAALLTGILYIEDLFAQHLMHKTVLSLLSWVVFGVLLFGRHRYGWRGPRAVRMTIWAMALLLLAFFGSKFVLELVLQRVPA